MNGDELTQRWGIVIGASCYTLYYLIASVFKDYWEPAPIGLWIFIWGAAIIQILLVRTSDIKKRNEELSKEISDLKKNKS